MDGHGTWRGVARDQIPWFPTVDTAECAGCKEFIRSTALSAAATARACARKGRAGSRR